MFTLQKRNLILSGSCLFYTVFTWLRLCPRWLPCGLAVAAAEWMWLLQDSQAHVPGRVLGRDMYPQRSQAICFTFCSWRAEKTSFRCCICQAWSQAMPVAADDVCVIPHHPTRIYRVAILRGGSLPLPGTGTGAWQIFFLFLIFFNL